MWELVEAPGGGVARSPHARRRGRPRRSPSAQFRDRCEVVAAGLHAMGVGPATRGVVAAAHPHRDGRAVHGAGPAGGGAEPHHPHLPRTRGGLRPAPDRGRSSSSSPGCGRTSTTWPWRTKIGAGPRPPARPWSSPTTRSPRATRPPCPRPRRRPATTVRWIYYTSGTTSDPKGVRHTDTDPRHRRPGPGHGRRHDARTTWGPSPSPSPTSPGPTISSWCSPSASPTVLLEAFVPGAGRRGVHAATGSPWPAGAPPSTRRI